MFGFTLDGMQELSVTCPRCGQQAQMLFQPSDKNVPIPLYGVKEAEDIIATVTTLPRADDFHFFCLHCWIRAQHCAVTKTPCRINDAALSKEIRRTTASMRKKLKTVNL